MLLQRACCVFPSNYFTSPTCLLSEWLIKVTKSQPSTGACFAFPPAHGGSVQGWAAWPYYKLIETLFRNTKVNISSHVIPISLQWILLNEEYWVADPMCYLNSRWDTHIQSLGMREGGWREWHQREWFKARRVLGPAAALLLYFQYDFTCVPFECNSFCSAHLDRSTQVVWLHNIFLQITIHYRKGFGCWGNPKIKSSSAA